MEQTSGEPIPEVVIRRLPIYARALAFLEEENVPVVSSLELGQRLRVTPAQIRKDLSYFGEFGKQGSGYNVKFLASQIREILGLTREWPMVLVGTGRLGFAIVTYGGFEHQGFHIVAAFDNDPAKVGTTVGDLTIQDMRELRETIDRQRIEIGIVATPAAAAQAVIDELVDCGARAILNYAPIAVHVPNRVRVRHIDPVVALQSLTYYLSRDSNRNGHTGA